MVSGLEHVNRGKEILRRMQNLVRGTNRDHKKIVAHIKAEPTKGLADPTLEAITLHGIAELSRYGQAKSGMTEMIFLIDKTDAATPDTPATTHGGKIRFGA